MGAPLFGLLAPEGEGTGFEVEIGAVEAGRFAGTEAVVEEEAEDEAVAVAGGGRGVIFFELVSLGEGDGDRLRFFCARCG